MKVKKAVRIARPNQMLVKNLKKQTTTSSPILAIYEIAM